MRRMKMFPAAGMRGRRAVLGKVREMGERRKVKRGWRRKGERRKGERRIIVMRMMMGVRRKGFV